MTTTFLVVGLALVAGALLQILASGRSWWQDRALAQRIGALEKRASAMLERTGGRR